MLPRRSIHPSFLCEAAKSRKWRCSTKQLEMFDDLPEAEIDALAADIEANGLRQPIEILPDGTVLAGHQRLRAVRKLGWKEVNCVVRTDLADDPAGAELFFIMDNLNRRQLSPIMKARCVEWRNDVARIVAAIASQRSLIELHIAAGEISL